jgi:hypothetical protein
MALSAGGRRAERVVLLLLQILVEQHAVGIAGAAHVRAHAGVAVAGKIAVARRVADDGSVVAAIRNVFKDGRHRLRACALR